MPRLKDIATIRTGIFAKPSQEGDLVYLQARHFDADGRLNSELHADLNAAVVPKQHLLEPNDILFASKGTRNFAAIFDIGNPPAVASTSFFVIRLTSTAVRPEYVLWFLNQAESQKSLKAHAIGSSIVSISKTVIEELNIPVPAMEIQNKLMQIQRLMNTESRLMDQIKNKRKIYMQSFLLKALK